jgi:hypothetical protein
MNSEIVTLKMPEALVRDASSVAAAQDVTIGHLVRQLLKKEVDRRLRAKTSNQTDERLIAALQALLVRDMAEACSWSDLAVRLRRHGYDLRPAGGGLTLHKTSCDTRVCKASELGFAYRTLVARFKRGMPDHPQDALNLIFEADIPPPFDVIKRD